MPKAPKAPWRVAIITVVPDVAANYSAQVRELGHEPVAVITARPNVDVNAFIDERLEGVDVVVPAGRRSLAPILEGYEADLALCGGFPWLVPKKAIATPKLGIVNGHIGLLPRQRGPFPVAWAIRNGDPEVGLTFHFMDADFDTGNVLAQAAVPVSESDDWAALWAKFEPLAHELLPKVFKRLAKGDKGDPQGKGAYHSGFEPEYAVVDTAHTAADVHRQVRAWSFMPPGRQAGPILELNGGRRRLVRTSLQEVEGAERLECADGPLWILDSTAA
jgi:methionyl-tRNA formyltransferase